MLGSTEKGPCSKFQLVCIHEHTVIQNFYCFFFQRRILYWTNTTLSYVLQWFHNFYNPTRHSDTFDVGILSDPKNE